MDGHLYVPDLEYCMDNAAMIAMAGYQRMIQGESSPLTLNGRSISQTQLIQNDHIISEIKSILAGPEPESDKDMSTWRARIDAIDQILLVLLNERSRSANEIGHIKKQHKLPIYCPRTGKNGAW